MCCLYFFTFPFTLQPILHCSTHSLQVCILNLLKPVKPQMTNLIALSDSSLSKLSVVLDIADCILLETFSAFGFHNSTLQLSFHFPGCYLSASFSNTLSLNIGMRWDLALGFFLHSFLQITGHKLTVHTYNLICSPSLTLGLVANL